MKKPYVKDRDVTYKMVTTHKYFRTLSEQELSKIISYMDYIGYSKLPGEYSYSKAKLLYKQFQKQKQTNKMNNLQRKAAVLKTANELLFANNTVTTLEVKNKLRKNFKNEQWFQNTDFGSGIEGVSELMNELASEGKFNYKNLGTYRVYTQGVTPVVTASSTPQSAAAETSFMKGTKATTVVKAPVKAKAQSFVSKTTVFNKLKESNGRFISVTWTKNDGKDRTVVGQYVNDQKPNVFGYVLVKDMAKAKAGKNAMVQVNPQTLKSVKTEGTLFVARQK